MSASQPTSAAPWRTEFLSHIKKMDSPTFVLSTLHHHDSSSVTPRSRTVVYRGTWAEIPVNPKNQAPLNPPLYESDLLTITTDARMEKVPELSPDGKNVPQTGGGPVEAVFWVTETQTQWRMRGHAYLLGQDIDDPSASHVRGEIEQHMRKKSDDNSIPWNWGKEITAHFGNLSPGMRGSFRNPPPGTKRDEKPDAGLGLGQKVEDLDDKIARKNFRVAVIIPDEVDQVDLSDPADGKRWNYKLTNGSWDKTELWP
ncbi:unnamed protein product [Fusarium graminearum]|nr:unnamed protein product [Fusarium graminearum]